MTRPKASHELPPVADPAALLDAATVLAGGESHRGYNCRSRQVGTENYTQLPKRAPLLVAIFLSLSCH